MTQEEYLKFHEGLCWEALNEQGQHRPPIAYAMSDSLTLFANEVTRLEKAAPDSFVGVDFRGRFAHQLILSATYAVVGSDEAAQREMFKTARALTVRKNNDYARPQDAVGDPFAIFKNFLRCERMGICSVEAGFLVRLSDKVARCDNLKRGMRLGETPAVADERLVDTSMDTINYTCLLMAYIETKKIEGAKK